MAATPYEILTFIGRGTGARDYQRLKAALERLKTTTVATSLPQTNERRIHRFCWIDEWTQRADARGHADGIDLIVPDWFYRAVLDDALVLTIDRSYFRLTGGLERWLYRLVRKHGGRQRAGWRFDFRHLYTKSASLSPFKRFAFELRDIARCRSITRVTTCFRRSWPTESIVSMRPVSSPLPSACARGRGRSRPPPIPYRQQNGGDYLIPNLHLRPDLGDPSATGFALHLNGAGAAG